MGRPLTFKGAIRLLRKRAALRRRIERMQARATAEGPVPPCPRCGSLEGCYADCPVAPWNLGD